MPSGGIISSCTSDHYQGQMSLGPVEHRRHISSPHLPVPFCRRIFPVNEQTRAPGAVLDWIFSICELGHFTIKGLTRLFAGGDWPLSICSRAVIGPCLFARCCRLHSPDQPGAIYACGHRPIGFIPPLFALDLLTKHAP